MLSYKSYGNSECKAVPALLPDLQRQLHVDGSPPQGANVDRYLAEAVARHDHKSFNDSKTLHTKVRVGQQKQKKAK